MDVGWMLDGWMDVGRLEKAELKPTQPSLAGAWLSLAKREETNYSVGHLTKNIERSMLGIPHMAVGLGNKKYWGDTARS